MVVMRDRVARQGRDQTDAVQTLWTGGQSWKDCPPPSPRPAPGCAMHIAAAAAKCVHVIRRYTTMHYMAGTAATRDPTLAQPARLDTPFTTVLLARGA